MALSTLAGEGDPIYLEGRETFTIDAPPVEIARPGKDWVFLDPVAQRAAAEKEKPLAEVKAEYATLKARLWHAEARALVSFHVAPAEAAQLELPAMEEALKADLGDRPGAQLVRLGRTKVAGAVDAVEIDYTCKIAVPRAPGQRELKGGASDHYFYVRIDVPRPKEGLVLTIFFEVPKERKEKAQPGWAKILRTLKLR